MEAAEVSTSETSEAEIVEESLDLDDFDVAKLKGFEIAEWLSRHEKDVSQYVIIDDEDCVLPSQREHLILTDPYLGITDKIARKIILYFNIM